MLTSKKKVFGTFLALVSLIALAFGNASVAHASPLASHIQSKHPVTPLANCLVTFGPHVNKPQEKTCLVKAPTQAKTTTQAVSPKTALPGCTMDVYQNGPYGSAAWANGWYLCAQGYGTFLVPPAYNDQASSWDSSCDGIFYANQPGTTPGAYFPQYSAGNFPWGGVPNDSLSSVFVYADC